MKPVRRILLLTVFVAVLVGIGMLTAQWFSGGDETEEITVRKVVLDSAAAAQWTRANPWLFREEGLERFRESLLIPFAVDNGLGARSVRRRGTMTEIVFPRDRPVHALAYELETRATQSGFRVVEGREIGSRSDRVEYRLQDASGRVFEMRLVIGQTVAAASFPVALVITGLGQASEADLKAWLEFPQPVTLVLPDTLKLPRIGRSASAAHDVLVELPMEPAAYPHIRPGPRALFIHHGRDEVEKIMRDRLSAHSGAAGFATRLGDRAIENPALMESVLGFVAEREVLFLDLTGSRRSLTPGLSLRTGAAGLTAVAQVAGSEKALAAELERRAAVALRRGEGIWVLRHAPGLPATLARVLRPSPSGEGGGGAASLLWVTLSDFRNAEE